MKLTITILYFMLAGIAYAQDEIGEKNDKIEAFRIAFITEKLNLTSKEATVFWPVYNEYSAKIKALRDKDKERVKSLKQNQNISEAEADKFINDYLAFKQQENELTRKYIVEFKKVLPPAKVARLVTLEHEFKIQLLNQLKNKRGKTDFKQ